MTDHVAVTGAERAAARLIIKRAIARGRAVDAAVVKIANAEPRARRTDPPPASGRSAAAE